ncbi:hypothetical protein [Paenibacillus sp. GXUN7292]|uniref:hypothetical protein n=1 Tax=Paenibacillus sp. GXUN7292 TaxID=3422499 RepID=UPI003D7D25FE
MKKINLLVLLTVLSMILVSCADADNKDKKKNQALLDSNLVHSITVKSSIDGVVSITDRKLIEQFAEAIHSAQFDSGQLDIKAPDYVATVQLEDSEGDIFSFWIKGEHEGLFTKSGQNGHYRLPGTAKAALLALFQSDEQQAEHNNLKINKNIKKITLATSLTHGAVNPEVTAEYTDNKQIEAFVRAIDTAEQIQGILNTSTPNYDIVLISENKQYSFHLWINELSEQAMLMDVKETHTGYKLTKESTSELKEIIFTESSFKELKFRAERNSNGDLVAKPIGLLEDNYMMNGGPVVKLKGNLYHTLHFFYGDHNAITALAAHDPSTDEVRVKWSDSLSSSKNLWNNAFMSSYNMLFPLDEDHLLFLESELTEESGQYHLSSFNVITGTVERLREDFWPLTDNYDYIYQFQWDADEQILFMQSFLGNVWFFNLKTGKDDIHLLKYRVIPHSTSGAPSLFLSPTFERFVHDDESGQLTFYNNKGISLRTVPLPADQYVPSEKIKWNPAGTIAWMDLAEAERNRILDVDIDYLKIAPQKINFYNPDGLLIGSIQPEGGSKDAALEVAGWLDAKVAVIKSYTVELKDVERLGLNVKDESYYLYDVSKKKKGSTFKSIPSNAAITLDRQRGSIEANENIIVDFKEITYLKEK